MKHLLLLSALAAFFLMRVACGFSQDLDLIVTAKGDSIACRIDSIGDTHVYYEMINRNRWVHTHIDKTDIVEYKRNVIDRRLFVFQPGTSIIESKRPVSEVSLRDIQKNSVYAGILSINYSRVFPGDRIGLNFAAGISFAPTVAYGGIGFMVETSVLIGRTKHLFEPGVLGLFDPNIVSPFIRTGYRYQGPEGFLFRAAPLFGYMNEITILPALSIGYSF